MIRRGKVKGRVLYLVDTGGGYYVAQLREWIVTSIMRPPRRYPWSPKGEKRVYLKTGDGNRSLGERDDFELDEWPGDYSAAKRAAWKRSIKGIESAIAREDLLIVDALAEGDKEWEADLRKMRTLLRRSLTKARKLAKKV